MWLDLLLAPNVFQRVAWVVVTDREVIVSPWKLLAGKAAAGELRMERPVRLLLTDKPRRMHFNGNLLVMPPEMVRFLGKKRLGKNAYVRTGEAASFAFDIARTTEADSQ